MESNQRFWKPLPKALGIAFCATVLLAPAAELQAREVARREAPKQGEAPSSRVESRVDRVSSSSRASRTRARDTRPSRTPSTSGGSSGRTRVEHGDRGRSSRGYRGSDRNRHRGSRHHYGSRHYYGGHYDRGYYYGSRYYRPYYRSYYGVWPWFYGWGGVTYVRERDGRDYGALDLDVSPEKAQIFVDGQYIGVADDYDGFPTYLWLEPGTYDVVIFKEGYETIARQYSVYPGVVIDVEDDMNRGEAVRPEDLISKSTERRDERLRRDRERQAEARRAEEWRSDRQRRGEALDARGEPARLTLAVYPADASVYLDGRFLGTGEDLAKLHAGMIIDPGSHTLEVVRPGYEAEEIDFEVEEGEGEEIEITLSEE